MIKNTIGKYKSWEAFRQWLKNNFLFWNPQIQYLVRKSRGLFLIVYVLFILIIPMIALIGTVITQDFSIILEKALNPVALSAYTFTLQIACLASLINTIFGLIVAWVLTRYDFLGKKLINAAIDLPFALPTSVAGLILITIYNDNGILGQFLHLANIRIVFTPAGVLLAMIFVSSPLIIRTLEPVLEELDTALEEAAWSLGATPWQTFSKVIFPTLAPAIITGFALSFSRALGEFGSIVMIASNVAFRDVVASVLIYQSLEQYDYVGASIIGIVIVTIALICLICINFVQIRQI